MGYAEKILKNLEKLKNVELIINPVPKIKIEGLPEDSCCTGCKFFRSLKETIEGDRIGWMNPNSGAKGFCNHPYKIDKMNDCAWVDFGCINKKEEIK